MRQPSRKGTKAWRKNIDLNDVETHLDEQRAEEMAGGRIVDKPDHQLFSIDKAGNRPGMPAPPHFSSY